MPDIEPEVPRTGKSRPVYRRVMPRHLYLFDEPDRFLAGTVGQPGSRTFYLQARDGARIVSVSLEKVQVAVLAERLGVLLDELDRRGIASSTAGESASPGPLDEPINEAFRVGTLSLGWEGDDDRIVIEARELGEEDEEAAEDAPSAGADDDPEGPDLVRVRLTASAARAFVAGAIAVVASGRPPCPMCGQPLDPQGHLCPRRNGTYVN
jgi:uncharacterized repeat protein (TIGR03847 family)